MEEYREKVRRLRAAIKSYAGEDIAVAFSGGADSGLLLKLANEAARETGRRVYGICLDTALHPAGEAEGAEKAAKEMGAAFIRLKIDEFENAGIEHNPEDRCYRCKKYMFQCIMDEARRLNAAVVMEGTNGDDLFAYRPGIRAVKELGAVSPLAEAGLSKEEVRKLAGEYGISVSDKPASPCLATRFPYGTRLDRAELLKVARAESVLREMGFYNVRVRVHGNLARIETDAENIPLLMERRESIVGAVKRLGYDYVAADLEGFRSGSMDIHLKAHEAER